MQPSESAVSSFLRAARVTVAGLEVESGWAAEDGHGLRTAFTIERNLKKQPNTAQVSLYNLHADHRNQLMELSGGEIDVVIEAGYRSEGLTTIYKGDLRDVSSEPSGDGTWVTTVRSGDGEKKTRTRKAQPNAKAGVSIETTMNKLASDLGIDVGNLKKALRDTNSIKDLGNAFGKGFNAEGPAMKRLEKLAKSMGLSASIQNKQLQLIPLAKSVSQTVITIRPGRGGLVNIPTVDNQGRCSFRVLLRPDLVPGSDVEIQDSVVANGSWQVQSVRYVGDTWTGDWLAECEGVRYAPA